MLGCTPPRREQYWLSRKEPFANKRPVLFLPRLCTVALHRSHQCGNETAKPSATRIGQKRHPAARQPDVRSRDRSEALMQGAPDVPATKHRPPAERTNLAPTPGPHHNSNRRSTSSQHCRAMPFSSIDSRLDRASAACRITLARIWLHTHAWTQRPLEVLDANLARVRDCSPISGRKRLPVELKQQDTLNRQTKLPSRRLQETIERTSCNATTAAEACMCASASAAGRWKAAVTTDNTHRHQEAMHAILGPNPTQPGNARQRQGDSLRPAGGSAMKHQEVTQNKSRTAHDGLGPRPASGSTLRSC